MNGSYRFYIGLELLLTLTDIGVAYISVLNTGYISVIGLDPTTGNAFHYGYHIGKQPSKTSKFIKQLKYTGWIMEDSLGVIYHITEKT